MEAFPVLSTVQHYVTDDAERYAQSRTMDFHNKADGHERRIATYLVENFRPGSDLSVRMSHAALRLADTSVILFLFLCRRELTTSSLLVSHLPYSALPERGHDARVPRLETPMGRRPSLRRCSGLAVERLLACHLMVNC